MFREGNINILNVLKIFPRLRAVRWVQDIKESVLLLIVQFSFHQSGMARAGPKKLQTNLCQPQLHQLTQASAKVGHAYM